MKKIHPILSYTFSIWQWFAAVSLVCFLAWDMINLRIFLVLGVIFCSLTSLSVGSYCLIKLCFILKEYEKSISIYEIAFNVILGFSSVCVGIFFLYGAVFKIP